MWLWVSGNRAGSKKVLRTLADRNGVDLGEQRRGSKNVYPYVPQSDEDDGNDIDGDSGWMDRVRVLMQPKYRSTTFLLMYVTFSSNFCYYGMIYVLPETFAELMLLLEEDPNKVPEGYHLSPALSLMLSALFEIPGVLLAIMLTNSVRRKMSLTISFSVQSIASIALVSAALHGKHAVVLTSLAAFSGKLFIASAFILVYLYILEVYPTSVRSSGLAVCMTVGRLGAVLVPLIAELCLHLADTTYYFFAVLGLVGFIAAICCLFLPMEPDGGGFVLSSTETTSLVDKDSQRSSRENLRV
jgi:MFS family permease